MICKECGSDLFPGWEADWLWCKKCRLFYMLDTKENQWLLMNTAETMAYIITHEESDERYERYYKWLVGQALDVYNIGLIGLLEVAEEYGGHENIPDEVYETYGLRLVRAMLWQTGLRDEKP
jgi:hypothetical protein